MHRLDFDRRLVSGFTLTHDQQVVAGILVDSHHKAAAAKIGELAVNAADEPRTVAFATRKFDFPNRRHACPLDLTGRA
ncbi:hypothetical protein [Qipengyuania sp. 483]